VRLHKDHKIEMIKHVPLFSKLSKQGLSKVAGIADEIDLPEGYELMREGERGREFVVLLTGAAEVRKRGRKINTLGEGDFLGEIALVTNVPRTATVTSTSPIRALVITDRDFATLMKDSAQVSKGIVEALGERLATELS
jgi:CRP/FNR family transcriptional regulator, cyclic AMP receptor protein